MSYVKSLLFSIGAVAALAGVASIATNNTVHAATTCARHVSDLVFPTPGSNEWMLNNGKITGNIGTKGNIPFCNNTTIYLSSYIMPDTWNQKSFPATALSQTFIESQSLTFKANQPTALSYLTVSYLEPCKNVQVDLYFGPEKKVLNESGHNGVYISHKFIKRDNEACKPRVTPGAPSVKDLCGTTSDILTIPATEGVSYLLDGKAVTAGGYRVTGTVTVTALAASSQYVLASGATTQWTFTLTDEACGQGGGSVEDTTTTTPQVLATSTTTPATLPNTGSSTQQIVTITAALAAFVYGIVYLVRAQLARVRG